MGQTSFPLRALTRSGATDGQFVKWDQALGRYIPATITPVTPGGSNTHVQFNDGGAFGGDAGLTYNKTTDVLTSVGGFVGNLTGLVNGITPLTNVIPGSGTELIGRGSSTSLAALSGSSVSGANVTLGGSLDLSGALTVSPAAGVSTLRTNSADSQLTYVTNRTSSTAIAHLFQVNGGAIDALQIADNGNFGIGMAPGTIKLAVGGISGEGVRLHGSAAGAASTCLLAFYDSGSTRIGYIGDASATDSDIWLNCQSGGFRFRPANDSARDIIISIAGNVGVRQSTFGGSAIGVFAQGNGTSPTTSPADCYQLYSADISAGVAAPHFRTENDKIIRIYQVTGWGLPTGTLTRTAFDQSTVTLPELAQRVAALITDLRSGHQLIGA